MSRIISSVAGTRIEPKDSYVFVRGTTATFKIIFTNNGVPTKVDAGTFPQVKILEPNFLDGGNTPVPTVAASINGVLVPGQEFEYMFEWEIPGHAVPLENYIVSYQAMIAGQVYNFGDEYFTIAAYAGQVGVKTPAYATVDDVRKKKFNIDDYLPEMFKKDLNSRNALIESHLHDASIKLREELNLFKARSNSNNYRLFTIFYAIYSILLAARGEDGSAVSDQNIMFWKSEWMAILAQEKRESSFQSLPLGRG